MGLVFPRRIGGVHYYPNKVVHGLWIVVRNVPGKLYEIAQLIYRHKLNILSVDTSVEVLIEGLGYVGVFLVIDLTDNPYVNLREIAEEIRKIEGVYLCEHIPPKAQGLVIDEKTLPLLGAGDRRIVIVSEGGIMGLLGNARKKLGDYIYGVVSWHTGYATGGNIYSEIKEYGIKEPLNFFDLFCKVCVVYGGFDRYEIVKFDEENEVVEVRVWGNVECKIAKLIGQAGSYFAKGMLAGFLSKLFGVDIRGDEIKCIAKGDEYCEFRFYKE